MREEGFDLEVEGSVGVGDTSNLTSEIKMLYLRERQSFFKQYTKWAS